MLSSWRGNFTGRGLMAALAFSLIVCPAVVEPAFAGTPQAETFEVRRLPEGAEAAPGGKPEKTRSGESASRFKMDSFVAKIVEEAKVSGRKALRSAKSKGMAVSGDRVQVHLRVRDSRAASVGAAIEALGGLVTATGRKGNVLQTWIPVDALERAAAMEDVLSVRKPAKLHYLEAPGARIDADVFAPLSGSTTTEGLGPMNAAAWHAAGITGAGVKVALIDGGFTGYSSLLGTELPSSITARNFVDGETDAQVDGGDAHGTACAEIVYDVAPDAQLYLVKIATNLDLEEAVDYVIAQGVDVISTSIGWYNVTPGDGTGEFADLVALARSHGIIWNTAAGNDRLSHWGGDFQDTDADAYHEFNDTGQEIDYLGPGDGTAYFIPAGYQFTIYLRWDDWTVIDQDYDLYLFRWNTTTLMWEQIAFSDNYQSGNIDQTPTEQIMWTTTGDSTAYGFAVSKYQSTRNVNLEAFVADFLELDERVEPRTLNNLADSPGAVTVAAVDIIAPFLQMYYSSEGPTNGPGGTAAGGFIKPDIAACSHVSTVSYGVEGFGGTSAATPHVAGAAALILSAYPAYTVDQVRNALEDMAIDMGTTGLDSQYGHGRLYLVDECPEDADLITAGLCGCGVAEVDTEGDGIVDCLDNCLLVANPGQEDFDGDGAGDVCDPDDDGDGYDDDVDDFPLDSSEWLDTDGDGIGNNADPDDDGDGYSDVAEIAHGTDPLDPEDFPPVPVYVPAVAPASLAVLLAGLLGLAPRRPNRQ